MSDQQQPQGDKLLVRTWSDVEAATVRQILNSHGIPCQVVSDVPHTVLPFTVDGLGEIRILVPAQQLQEARELLAEHLRQGLEVVDGGKQSPDDAVEDEDEGDGKGDFDSLGKFCS